ncbi:hypothetical protein [Saccharopolyspora sp. NPDC002578]
METSGVLTARRRRFALVAGAVVVLLLIAVAGWHLPFAGQWRETRAAAELLPAEPGAPGQWRRSADFAPAAPSMTGLRDRWTRVWKDSAADGHEPGFDETAHRFASPTWAWLTFRLGDPSDRYAEKYDRITEVPAPVPPEADEARFYCARFDGRPEECTRWYAWIRYGQYIVSVTADPLDDGTTPNRTGARLERILAEADRTFTTTTAGR